MDGWYIYEVRLHVPRNQMYLTKQDVILVYQIEEESDGRIMLEWVVWEDEGVCAFEHYRQIVKLTHLSGEQSSSKVGRGPE